MTINTPPQHLLGLACDVPSFELVLPRLYTAARSRAGRRVAGENMQFPINIDWVFPLAVPPRTWSTQLYFEMRTFVRKTGFAAAGLTEFSTTYLRLGWMNTSQIAAPVLDAPTRFF